MPRKRDLRPSFFSNEYLAELPFEARLLFAGLWTIADRRGRLEDRPIRIKGALFPYDNINVDELLQALANSEDRFVVRYMANGKKYIQISNFEKHQSPHKDETESAIPPPPTEHHIEVVEAPPGSGGYTTSPPREHHPNTPCSLYLVACSLEQEACGSLKPLSGKPDGAALDDTDLSGECADMANQRLADDPCLQGETSLSTAKKKPHLAIIDHLNAKCGTTFKATTKATREHINARLKEGFTLDDFIAVIDKKHLEWGGNPNMAQYLRPATLFGTKFEGYLNQPWTDGVKRTPTQIAQMQLAAMCSVIDSEAAQIGVEYDDTS